MNLLRRTADKSLLSRIVDAKSQIEQLELTIQIALPMTNDRNLPLVDVANAEEELARAELQKGKLSGEIRLLEASALDWKNFALVGA